MRKSTCYAREALQPFENSAGENPYTVQRDLQEIMQHNVGIVRDEGEMRSALDHLKVFWERAARVGVIGNRDFNPGWHTALDLKNLLTVSEAITRAALERKESRGAQFREDYPEKDERFAKVNTIIRKASRRNDGSSAGAVAGDAGLFEADHRGDEMSGQKQATFRIWRGDGRGGEFRDYTTGVSEGMVVLDAVNHIQATQANDLASSMELQGRQMRLVFSGNQWHAEVDVHDATERSAARKTGHRSADEGVSNLSKI